MPMPIFYHSALTSKMLMSIFTSLGVVSTMAKESVQHSAKAMASHQKEGINDRLH
jgi:hypothetical protein